MAISGRLTRKLMLAFLFVALVPLGLLAVFGPRIVRGHFEDLSRERIANVLGAVARDLDLRRDTIKLQVDNLATDPELVRELALVAPTGEPNLGLIDHVVERRDALGLDWLEVTDGAGIVLARGHARGDFGDSLALDPLIAAGRRGTSLAAVSTLVPPDSGLAILAAAPVVFEGNVIGVVRGGAVLDRAFIHRMRLLSGADLAVIDSAGNERVSTFMPDSTQPRAVVSALDRVAVAVPTDSADAPPPDSTREIRLEGVPYRVGALALAGPTGAPVGRLAVGVSEMDLERTLNRLLRLLGLAALIAVFIAVVMALVFAVSVARPVRALAHAAQRVAHGDLDVRLPAGPDDEVGDLMANFNAMAVDLAGSRERLVRGERQAAWAQVARRLAHDIRNPLTPIQLAIEEVERARAENDPHLGEVIARAGKTIKAEVRTLRELVREFGDFARSPAPRPEPVDLRELLDHAIDLYVPSSVEVTRDYGFEGELHADPDLLARAFGNLVKNACEAMGGQGTLGVHTRGTEGGVAVTVEDTGPGVAAADREKIFTPYFTTKEDGTGLGLAIVRRVVEDHGGKLELVSGGHGARFVATLPLRPVPAKEPAHG